MAVSSVFTPRRSPDRARHRPSPHGERETAPTAQGQNEGASPASPQKPCRTCGITKPLDEFYPEKLGRYGRKGSCKICYEKRRGRVPASPKAATRKAQVRSWAIDQATGCWLWQGRKNHAGYGRVDTCTQAHRWVYEQFVGPIPEGLHLDHLCRTKACVNPDHLEPVTNQVNIQRGIGAKLSPESVQRLRRDRNAGMTYQNLAAKYGISPAGAWSAYNKVSWRNVA